MNITKYCTSVALGAALMLTSCSDFLDRMPDNRVSLDTTTKVRELLVSGYLDASYSVLAELSSDNFVDNTAPDEAGTYYPMLSARERMHDELFAWEDVKSSDGTDSPSALWGGCYSAIAVANHALEALDGFEGKGFNQADINALRAEALLIRSYHHFILVNLFCQAYKDENLSQADQGIPYVTEPEKEVFVNYARVSVAEVYALIEKDLLEALPLSSNHIFEADKYHFNRNAANAFAARFYLYKRDYDSVIKYANAVLGDNPAGMMRNYNLDAPTTDAVKNDYVKSSHQCNLLLLPTYSTFDRIFGTRYACNRDASKGTIFGKGPTWPKFRFSPCYNGRLYTVGGQEYGVYYPKSAEFFEYTDKVAGIGYPRVVRAEFTVEELLLCRAEAYVYKNDFANALKDLAMWDDGRKLTPTTNASDFEVLTEELIKKFYTPDATLFVKKLNASLMSPEFVVTPAQEPYIHCVLHFRRLETIFDGLRWFDVKRYGIELTHTIGKNRVETLTWDDERRALQVPQEVIAAGFEPNIRKETKYSHGNMLKANLK